MKILKIIIFLFINFLFINNIFAFDELWKTPLVSTWTNNLKNIIIENQKDLENYLEKTWTDFSWDSVFFRNSENISFPKNIYFMNSVINWYFEWNFSWNIDFWESIFAFWEKWWLRFRITWNQNNRLISWGKFYGSVKFNSVWDNWSVKWINSWVYISLIKASNVLFDNMIFNNSHQYNSHIFDIQGSNNVKISNSTFAWYGWTDNFSDEDLLILTQKNIHFLLAEAIQIDQSSFGWAWSTREKFLEDKRKNSEWNTIFEVEMFDEVSSYDIIMDNNKFIPYNWLSWNWIIKWNSEIINRSFSASVWSHSVSNKDNYRNITITNNIFQNTIKPDFKNILQKDPEIIFSAIHIRDRNLEEFKKSFVFKNNKFIDTDLSGKIWNWEIVKNYMWFYWYKEENEGNNNFYNLSDEKIFEIDFEIQYIYDSNLEKWEEKILKKWEKWEESSIFWILKEPKKEIILVWNKEKIILWWAVNNESLTLQNDDRVTVLNFFEKNIHFEDLEFIKNIIKKLQEK